MARGAKVIEKHFTLSRQMPGPDHRASLEPDELAAMVQGIRNVELALGDGIKHPQESELKNIAVARKSLFASQDISRGAPYTPDNLAIKRPGSGLSPNQYWRLIQGTKATKDYNAGDMIFD